MPIQKDYRGLKYHKLTLISHLKPGRGTKGSIWLAKCDCGNTRDVAARLVVAGRIKSCGKCPKSQTQQGGTRGGYRARSAEERRARTLYIKSVRRAERENIEWHLTPSNLNQLDLRMCYICHRELSVRNLVLVTDNPTGGYTVRNTHAVCPDCRYKMRSSNLLEFIVYVCNAYSFIIEKTSMRTNLENYTEKSTHNCK